MWRCPVPAHTTTPFHFPSFCMVHLKVGANIDIILESNNGGSHWSAKIVTNPFVDCYNNLTLWDSFAASFSDTENYLTILFCDSLTFFPPLWLQVNKCSVRSRLVSRTFCKKMFCLVRNLDERSQVLKILKADKMGFLQASTVTLGRIASTCWATIG